MTHPKPADYCHLKRHASARFPRASITITHTKDERIYIEADGHRYTFEIGSDDDEYVFTDGEMTFAIPLMEIDEDF